MRELIRIIKDAEGNPAVLHIRRPHMIGEEGVAQMVEQHMFGEVEEDRRVAVLRLATTRRNTKPPVIDPNDLERRFGREKGIKIATFRIMNWPQGAIIRPAITSATF